MLVVDGGDVRFTIGGGPLEAMVVEEFKDSLSQLELDVLERLEDGQSERDIASALDLPRYQVRTIKERLQNQASRDLG